MMFATCSLYQPLFACKCTTRNDAYYFRSGIFSIAASVSAVYVANVSVLVNACNGNVQKNSRNSADDTDALSGNVDNYEVLHKL